MRAKRRASDEDVAAAPLEPTGPRVKGPFREMLESDEDA